MSQQNVDMVRVAYDVAWPQRSVEGFRDRFAEDFTWRQRPEWPGRSAYGRDEMPELWADLDETFAEYALTAVDYTDAGDYVVVTVHTSACLRAIHDVVEGTVWHVWRIRDGLAAEACVYGTREEAFGAAGVHAT